MSYVSTAIDFVSPYTPYTPLVRRSSGVYAPRETIEASELKLLTRETESAIHPEATHLLDDIIENDAGAVNDLVAMSNHHRNTLGHIIRTGLYAVHIGLQVGLNYNRLRTLGIAALRHDTGKLDIATGLLGKVETLEEEDREAFRLHPFYGVHRIDSTGGAEAEVRDATLYHHSLQRNPYPIVSGAVAYTVPIVAVADVFDALTAKRAYNNPLLVETAKEVVSQELGHTDFKNLVDLYTELLPASTVELERNYLPSFKDRALR